MQSEWLVPVNAVAGVLPGRSVVDGPPLQSTDSAVAVLTDFTRDHPATVHEDRQIDDALQDMIQLGVRALLVYRDQHIVGLITSYDIQGERPMQFLQLSNYSRHQDLRVGHIMTPWDRLLAVDWRGLQSVSVGEVLKAFNATGLTHLIVVERDSIGSKSIVRGLISRRRLERRMSGFRLAG